MIHIQGELLSVIVMLVVLIDIRRTHSLYERDDTFFAELILTYICFLMISIGLHMEKDGISGIPLVLQNILWVLHIGSFPTLLLVWQHFISSNVDVDARHMRILDVAQIVPLVIFMLVVIINLQSDVFFIFSDLHSLESGRGLALMSSLCLLYCVVMFIIVLVSRKTVEEGRFLLFALTPLVLTVSLGFFLASREHMLFVISASFMILMNYLFIQRRKISKDVLTGLLNRNTFMIQLEKVLSQEAESVLVVLDLENFRSFNQRYGHDNGDKLLTLLSDYLISIVPEHQVFRLAGDRLALLLHNCTQNHAVQIIKVIEHRMSASWAVMGASVTIRVNIAVVMVPEHGRSVGDVLDKVEFTIAELKARRRLTVLVFNTKIMEIRQRKLDVMDAIRNAVNDDSKVRVYYQPIYNIATGKMVSAEALVRIEDEVLGRLMPTEFIPLAEQTGSIVKLTTIILRKVCRRLRESAETLAQLEYISVNLSVEDFSSPDVAGTLLGIIKAEGIASSRIGFELTESMLIESYAPIARTLSILAASGVTFALDDFGIGYSNIIALSSLPFNTVKIDRSVVVNAESDYKMLELLVLMLRKMGKKLVAEGVETHNQLEIVRQAGIHWVQGFLFSPPVSDEEFLELLKTQPLWKRFQEPKPQHVEKVPGT
jgi:diguanylate cyclase (GGDEF)-like protein